jgi:hypothetical protein
MSSLDDAIRRKAEELSPGQPVIGWALVYATLGDEDGTHDLTVIPAGGQPVYATHGMLHLSAQQAASR